MNKNHRSLVFLLSLALVGSGYIPSIATQKDPVTVINSGIRYPNVVPKNLVWGAKSISSATKAIDFQFNEIENEISMLKSKGATRIVKTFVKNSSVAYPDWKEYVQSISQYTLTGFSSSGKSIGASKKLPSDIPNLANRLVYLKQANCSVGNSSLQESLETCLIVKPIEGTYLRASLRSSIGMGQVTDIGGDIIQQLMTCLVNKSAFTVINGVFDCPANAKVFGGERSFKLRDNFATRSYAISIDKKKHTAIFTYGPRDFTGIALTGVYDSGSVVRFG
jgi:hypothetical protein